MLRPRKPKPALGALLLLACSLARAAEPLVIVALGDSTTAGTPYFRSPREAPPDGAGRAEAPYPYWLARARPGWKVLNRGVNGERSDEIRARFAHDVVEQKPRYVIILAGVNDVYQGAPASETERNLAAMYRDARAAGIVPIAASVLPFDRATRGQSRRIAELNAWISGEAARRGIPFCDLHAAAADPKDPDRLRGSPDGLHPDVATYARMGEAAARLIAGLEGRRINRGK